MCHSQERRSSHAESIIGAVLEPFCSLVREHRVSFLLPSDSSLDSLRAQQRLHIERSKILDVREVLAVASAVDPTQEFGSGCSRSSETGPGDRRCMARGIFRMYSRSASLEMTSSDCHSAAWHRR